MRARILALLLLAAAGCAEEFTPRSVLFDLRVLAIRASPLEAGPDEDVTLDAVRVAPPGQAIADERWSFCPFSIGSTAGYACAVPACERDLPTTVAPADGASAPVTANPGALALECLALLSGSGGLPPGFPTELPEKVEVLFRYVVVASDGSEREAVQRLPVYPAGAPADRNLPPTIASVSIGGTVAWESGAPTGAVPALRPGGELDVLARVGGAQLYVDGGRTLTESLVVSFYTTAGRFDFDRANGPDALVTLEYDEITGPGPAQLWAVARDLRGGQTVAGPMPVTVE
jgi:hypothetical protein